MIRHLSLLAARALVAALVAAAATAATPPRAPGEGQGQEQEPAASPAIASRAGIEVTASTQRAFVGEAVVVTVRVRLDRRLWREQLIQLFRQRTDVAARIATPWAEPIDGFDVLSPPPSFAGDASAVVDGAVAALRRAPDPPPGDATAGATAFAVFELAQRLVPRRAGTLTIPRAELRYAWAERFTENFFGEREPEGRQDAALASEPVAIEVAPLPTAGRPDAFAGLVGQVAAAAELARPAGGVRVGDGVELRLVVAGDGDLRPFRAPALADLRGFWVRGVREEAEPGRRVAIYDLLALRAGPQTIPAIPVPFFAPESARYENAATAPIEVAVQPAADGTMAIDETGAKIAVPGEGGEAAGPRAETPEPGAPAPVPGVDVLFDVVPVPRAAAPAAPPDFAAPRPPAAVAVIAWLALPWLAAVLLWLVRRRADTREVRLRRRRRRTALRVLRRAFADRGAERGAALARWLAAWLDCDPAAVVAPGLPSRLTPRGVTAEHARRIDDAFDALAGARFGGGGSRPGDGELLALAARVDAELRAHERVERRRERRERRHRALPAGAAAALLMLAGSVLATPLAAQQRDVPAPATDSPADLPTDLPTEAARHFAAGDAARAFELWQQALATGDYDATALCFDLGTCAHRLGRPAESVLWYERALRTDPLHLESRANLRLVRQQLGLAETAPRPLLRTALDGALARIAATGPVTALALGALLQIGGFALWFFTRRRAAALLLIVFGLATASLAAAEALARPGATAVVLRDGVRLLAEPHERAGAVAALPPGAAITVLESSPRWARVRHGDDQGWVETRTFTPVALR